MGFSGASNTTTTEVDPRIMGRNLDLYRQSQDYLINTPWQMYPGSQIAGFQPMQMAGMGLLTDAIFGPGAYSQYGLGYRRPSTYDFTQGWNPWYYGDPWPPPPGGDPNNPPPGPGSYTPGSGEPGDPGSPHNPWNPPNTGDPDDQSNWDPFRSLMAPSFGTTTTSSPLSPSFGINPMSIPSGSPAPSDAEAILRAMREQGTSLIGSIPGSSHVGLNSVDEHNVYINPDAPDEQLIPSIQSFIDQHGLENVGVPYQLPQQQAPVQSASGLLDPAAYLSGPTSSPVSSFSTGSGPRDPSEILGLPGAITDGAGGTSGIGQYIVQTDPNDPYNLTPYSPPPPQQPPIAADPNTQTIIDPTRPRYGPSGSSGTVGYSYRQPDGGGGPTNLFSMPQFDPSQMFGVSNMFDAANMAGGMAMGTPDMAQFFNPFTDQVVDRSLMDLNRARQLGMEDIASSATASGAFGGSRHGVAEAETNRAFMDAVGRTSGQLRSQGFDTAAQLAQDNAYRQMQAAGLLGQLGQGLQGSVFQAANALQGMGAQQQLLAQSQLDRNLSDFYAARDYPLRGLQLQQSILHGMPVGMSYTQQQSGSPASAILGGLLGLGGAALGSPWFGGLLGQ